MFSIFPAALVALSWSSVATAQYLAIQGVTGGVGSDGSRPARLNINSLQNDPYAWPLYVQALTAMQSTAQTSLTSYFEISGIHGRPYKGWDNIIGDNTDTGYCTHDSILFPSWHRPYLALFEDQLSAQAQTIASQYNGSDKSKYQAAAQTLRMPFWDWASSPAIPNIANTATLTITTPSGPKTVNNPLYRYTMPTLDPTYFPRNAPDGYLSRDKTTIRDPNANAALTRAGLTGSTYNLFSRITDYSSFATQAVSGSSLEAVHGTVHVCVGGNNGHMSQLSYAAFDPIFWLHHTNVDRIFALWQATHPDAYIPSGGVQDSYGTYTITPGSTDYSSTILTPFTSTAAGDFWTSDTARSLSAWGYTYPEINDWNQTKDELAASVTQQVNALYGSRSGALAKKHPRDIHSTKAQEWFVDIAVSKFELGSSFSVLLFLGDVPTDSSTWTTTNNLAGSLFVSTPPYQRKGAQLTTHGEIDLKQALDNAHLSDTSEASVVEYLTKNLQWRVQKTDGTVVDTSACLSLKITVKVEDVTYPTSEYGFPSYGNSVEHPEITKGKATGY